MDKGEMTNDGKVIRDAIYQYHHTITNRDEHRNKDIYTLKLYKALMFECITGFAVISQGMFEDKMKAREVESKRFFEVVINECTTPNKEYESTIGKRVRVTNHPESSDLYLIGGDDNRAIKAEDCTVLTKGQGKVIPLSILR